MRTTSSHSRGRTAIQKLLPLAPLVSLILLLVYPWAIAQNSVDAALQHKRHLRVREAINQLPEKLGRWIKYDDVAIPTGALAILNPNAYISRIYQRIGEGRSVFATVMVIHCSDVRDMSMHFPPVCYPRSGWTALEDASTDWIVNHGVNRQIMGRTYCFARMEKNGLERVITVADTFLLPKGTSTRSMADLLHVASRHRRSIEGVAQVQIYFEADFRNSDGMAFAEQLVGEIIEGLPEDLLQVLDGDQPAELGTAKRSER